MHKPTSRERSRLTRCADDNLIWDGDVPPQIQAMCFDGFGTLVDIRDKRRPFKTLLGNAPALGAVTRALTTPTALRDLARDICQTAGKVAPRLECAP